MVGPGPDFSHDHLSHPLVASARLTDHPNEASLLEDHLRLPPLLPALPHLYLVVAYSCLTAAVCEETLSAVVDMETREECLPTKE